jgi:hypothetical protein
MNGGSRPKSTEVKIGLMNRISAQVISGLSVGDVVVTGVESTSTGAKASSGGLGGRRGPML